MTKDYTKYHQRTLAKTILEEGFQSSYYNSELGYLARYFKESGDKPQMIKEKLIDFIKTHYPKAILRNWMVQIDKAVAASQKDENVLIECSHVDMYLSEIEYIDSLDISENAKRVIFAIMVHKKLDKFCYELRKGEDYKIFTYSNNRRLHSLPRVAKLNKVRNIALDVMHELYKAKLVDVIECKGSPFKLNFADQIVFEGALAVRISDYDHIGLYWEWLHGKETVGLCCKCWQAYSTKAKNRCYCEDHQGYQAMGDSKEIVCVDCGKQFVVPASNHKTVRCVECQKQENAKKKVEWKAAQKE